MLKIFNRVTPCFVNSCRNAVTKPKREETVCRKAVNDAEKIVGYPTSFLSLRWLLNDEVANVARHIRKLIGTNHPLLATARDLIIGDRSPTWGLIVLLVSKAGGLGKDFLDTDKDVTAGILHSQRVLAEVTEMIRTSFILHRSVLNFGNSPKEEIEDYSDLNFGNTLSLLTGDYLLSNSFRELANLKNYEVNELMSTSLRDQVEGEFIRPRDRQNRPFPGKPAAELKDIQIPNNFDFEPFQISNVIGQAKAEWTLRHFLSGGSLLARSCQASLKLANHAEKFQKLGYLFGRNMALAWQAHFDLESFDKGSFSLISAPVMFHLQSDPNFYAEILKGSENITKCDYATIRKIVSEGSGISKTLDLKQEFIDKSLQNLDEFKDSEAKEALKNIIQVL